MMKHRKLIALFLLTVALVSRAQIGDDYNPSSPSDPQPHLPNVPVQKYTLNLKATPVGSGSFNITSANVLEGERYNLRAYPNTDFAFVAWICDGDTLSKVASYDYTMPSHNVDITGVFTYRPSSPSDPQPQVVEKKYQLTLRSEPINSGSFNISNERLVVGSMNSLHAYSNTDFVFMNWTIGDSVLSTNSNIDFVMPENDVEITGHFKYNPSNPANPNKNYWNKETGEVIVDDFSAGSLSSALSSAISGNNSNDVAMITVAGRMNDNDFGIVNNYKKCYLLDLSRVTGFTEVPSYAFDYTNLESVYLPATVEKIGACAFAECAQLSALTLYSMTPPVLESGVFQGVPEGLVVYVPAAAIAQYQDAEVWSKFTMLPIQENLRSISISLPKGTDARNYAQMWLELTNTKSGQRMHYVMTDRQTYTFANVIRNTSWNVVLRNERGDVFGKIDNVEVEDEDVAISFSSLSKPQRVTLFVLTPDGKDVTDQVQVTWTDVMGNYLAQGSSLSGLPVGYQLNYRISLQQELAIAYNTPQSADYTLKEGGNTPTCQLEDIKQVRLTGKVKDSSTGLPLSGAVVSFSQTFGGKYSKTVNAKTDNNGAFLMEVFNVPTSIAFAAIDYISQTVDFTNNEFDELHEYQIPDVSLKAITGAIISVGFTYTTVEGDTQSWFSDYLNVDYALYNVTKGRAVSQYNVQYPQIVLLEEVEDGDVLRLTATSRTNAFMPVETIAFIAEQKASATFDVKELGKIQSTYAKNDNASVVGSLYDAAGKLMKTYDYSGASLTIDDLADGHYTLVTMGGSRFFNTIYDLSQMPQTGLLEGADYVKNLVEVKSGAVSQVKINEVPKFNEIKFYYTGANTSFMVNKPSITVGNYLTLTGHLDFKPEYADKVSNVQLVVDLPENSSFVENSVMVGNSISDYSLDEGRIFIPLARYTDRVRFCIIPTLGGEYAPSAFVQFNLGDEIVTQPIGSANYTTKDLSISVPSMVAKKTISVSGTAIGISSIGIYDNDVLIGQTTSLANGDWQTTCELNEPYNLSKHNIYAKVTTKKGLELQSEMVECQYDMNAVVVKTVTMINTAHPATSLNTCEYVTVFDFLSNTTSAKSYNYWPSYPDFTFLVDFTKNDTVIVKDVYVNVFTDHNDVKQIKAEYNGKLDKWVAVSNFSSDNLPVNVSVSFNAYINPVLDMSEFNQLLNDMSQTCKEFKHYKEIINAIDYENVSSEELSVLLKELDGGYEDDNFELSDDYLESLSEEELAELEAHYESIIGDSILSDSIFEGIGLFLNLFSDNIYFTKTLEDGTVVSISQCKDYDKDALIVEGFDVFLTTTGGMLCYYSDENTEVYVDVENNREIRVQRTSLYSTAKRISEQEFQDGLKRFKELINELEEYIGPIEKAYKDALKALNMAVDDIYNNFLAASLEKELSVEFLNKEKTKYRKLQLQLYRIAQEEGVGSLNYSLQEARLRECSKWVKIYRNQSHYATIRKFLADKLYKCTKPLPNFFKKTLPIAKYIEPIWDGVNVISDFSDLYFSIPRPCKEDESGADKCRNDALKAAGWCFGAVAVKVGTNLLLDMATIGQLAGSIPTGGISAATGVFTFLVNIAGSIFIDLAYKAYVENKKTDIIIARAKLQCEKPILPDPQLPPCPPVPPVHDPSGYVYEGVSSNRLQGVTATVFYKEYEEDMYGDLHENIVKWNAEEYAQENPLFTDENGMYRWDVPQGMWQVKYEKTGYETTYSDWLPVPPPQLDVNIAMTQNRQPEVKKARAFEQAVEVEFDKYMMPELLTTDNIIVMQNGKQVEGNVELLNNEIAYEGKETSFASKVRFNASKAFTAKEVTLMVSNRMKSYSGIRMQDDFSQSFTVEKEIKQIVCVPETKIAYGEAGSFVVNVIPASAAAGKTLRVSTASTMIALVETTSVTIDKNGQAKITVNGELPGSTAVVLTIDGYDLSTTTMVHVEQLSQLMTATPTVNIASGSVVDKGTEIKLFCATENAVIYYTLDGSCPCNDSPARKVYNGTPIIVNENVTIRVMAVAPDKYESDVAEFTYVVYDPNAIDEVALNDGIQVYPLPVRDKLNVTAGGKTILNVSVASLNGVVVASSAKAATTVTLDVHSFAAGVYIVCITTEDGTVSRKVMKVE